MTRGKNTCSANIITLFYPIFQVFTIQEYKEALDHNCYSLPLWVLLMGNFSQLSMMINSSINFFIYCFMSSVFRDVLYEAFVKVAQLLGCGKVSALIASLLKLPLFG